ncbi:MAG: hypothetical protein HQK69_06490 [Desulfamplus sp.]|nr:hypothetical protein [Desulfamplus sp.]
MGRFERFELGINKVQDYPLVFEAVIPPECSLFQDVRRYQSLTAHLDVRIINIDGKIEMEQGVIPVALSKISSAERKELIEYLKIRISRGDNIGSAWAFFRSENKKRPLIAVGANVVYKNPATGYSRAVHLLSELQKSGNKINTLLKSLVFAIIIAGVSAGGYFAYYGFIKNSDFKLSDKLNFGKYFPGAQPKEMQFYKSVFPDIYQWLYSEVVDEKEIAKELLNPEYVKDIIACMDKSFYRDSDGEAIEKRGKDDTSISNKEIENSNNAIGNYKSTIENYRGTRLALFVYFNYNQNVKDALEKYKYKLDSTEFGRLAKIYSCNESGYTSNIFYFKVGDLAIKPPQINQYLTDNMISHNDYKRLRDTEDFSEMLKKDDINFRLKNFLSDVYTFTPLKVENPIEDIEWYLLTKSYPKAINLSETNSNSNEKISFAAFFKINESTMVPRDISIELIGHANQGGAIFQWYKIDDDQKRKLNLNDNSTMIFTDKFGQNFKLEVIERKVKELALEKIEGDFPVTVHRDLLMEDSKGKYGIQCYDPVTSLVLSNLISKSSFESDNKITLKRDPIQINTSLIQLSKDDSSSTQVLNISPGKTGVVNLFKDIDHFRAKLSNGQDVKFEKADVNLFNPFSFTVYDDSITFSYKHEISGMEFSVNNKILKIVKSEDGGHQIVEIN